MQSQGDTTASGNNETGCVNVDESRSQAVETTEKKCATEAREGKLTTYRAE